MKHIFRMYSLIQVGSFVQPYVNSLSSIMSWLPILSQPLADGADVYPGEGWCKVHFTVYIKVLYEDLILWMRSNKRKCRPHSNQHSYDVLAEAEVTVFSQILQLTYYKNDIFRRLESIQSIYSY